MIQSGHTAELTNGRQFHDDEEEEDGSEEGGVGNGGNETVLWSKDHHPSSSPSQPAQQAYATVSSSCSVTSVDAAPAPEAAAEATAASGGGFGVVSAVIRESIHEPFPRHKHPSPHILNKHITQQARTPKKNPQGHEEQKGEGRFPRDGKGGGGAYYHRVGGL